MLCGLMGGSRKPTSNRGEEKGGSRPDYRHDTPETTSPPQIINSILTKKVQFLEGCIFLGIKHRIVVSLEKKSKPVFLMGGEPAEAIL